MAAVFLEASLRIFCIVHIYTRTIRTAKIFHFPRGEIQRRNIRSHLSLWNQEELGAILLLKCLQFHKSIKEENELLWKTRSVDGHESDLRCVEGGVLALRLPGDGVLVVPDLAVAGLQPLLHGLPLRGVQLVHQPRPLTLGHLAKLQHKELWDATVSRLEICTPLLFGNQPP